MNFLKGPSNPTNMLSTKLPTVTDKKSLRLRKINKLGGGTYGRVYQATTEIAPAGAIQSVSGLNGGSFVFNPSTKLAIYAPKPGQLSSVQHEIVAVKENFVSPNFRQTIGSLRELDMLNIVKDHPYCIKLKNVIYEIPYSDGSLSPSPQGVWIPDKIFFVLEKGDMDGDKYIRPPLSNGMSTFRLVNERKLFAVQVMMGIEFIHSRGIYHRDLKPHNIICFMNTNGDLTHAKICDFGLTQYYCKQSMSLPGFVTLWYRAPEISLTKDYDYKIDVWSLGCILFELFSSNNRRFMQPSSDELLINDLIEKLPFPTGDYNLALQLYSGITRSYERYQQSRRSIEQQLAYTGSQIAQFNSCQLGGKPNSGTFNQLVNLIENCLVVDPRQRYSISQCLNHPFFDGYKELIDQTRALYGITCDGEWILRPSDKLVINNNNIRKRGMDWVGIIYSNRMSHPVSSWYSHRIFFHGVELFDRYINLVNPSENTVDGDIVMYINTFMFMSAKYFRVMVDELGLDNFAIGVYPKDLHIFKAKAQNFEEHVVRDVFKCVIYQPTIFEFANEFLSENGVACLIKALLSGNIPTGTPLNSIISMYSDSINEANKRSSPMPSPVQGVTVTVNRTR
jgi:serine/threonine protein kinase